MYQLYCDNHKKKHMSLRKCSPFYFVHLDIFNFFLMRVAVTDVSTKSKKSPKLKFSSGTGKEALGRCYL